MEAEGSSETLTNIYQNIWQHIKEGLNLHGEASSPNIIK
jgi:hypothetical protein